MELHFQEVLTVSSVGGLEAAIFLNSVVTSISWCCVASASPTDDSFGKGWKLLGDITQPLGDITQLHLH